MSDNKSAIPRSLKWMREILASSAHSAANFGTDPFAIEIKGRKYAAATNGSLAVAVPSKAALNPPPRGIGKAIVSILDVPKGGHDCRLAELRTWSGRPDRHNIYFDNDGCGPFDVPTQRPGFLFGVSIDVNLLAHVLQAFQGGKVRVVHGGPLEAIRLTDSKSMAAVMPCHIATFDEDGPRFGYGRFDWVAMQ